MPFVHFLCEQLKGKKGKSLHTLAYKFKAMEASQIKEMFLKRLPQELVPRLPKIHDSIIDEGIEKILDGSIDMNGSKPETPDEVFVALGLHFIAGSATLEAVISGVRQAYPDDNLNLNINYREETHTLKFDRLNK